MDTKHQVIATGKHSEALGELAILQHEYYVLKSRFRIERIIHIVVNITLSAILFYIIYN